MTQDNDVLSDEWDAAAPIILPSTHSTGSREAALVYFSGAQVDAEHCVSLARAIQAEMAAAGTALHVALPAPPPITPAFFSAAGQQTLAHAMLDTALAALEDQCGFRATPQDLFLGGHSMGSMLVAHAAFHSPGTPADTIAAEAHGLCVVCHGGYIREQYRALATLRSVPTAEILGDRDGLIRLNNFAELRSEVDANVLDAAERARIAPVVILPGVSHTSFCDGASTEYVAPRDTPPTAPTAAGTSAIADATAKFMLMSDPEAPADAVRAAAAFFEESTRSAAEDFLDVYRGALARDKAGDTCRDVQRLVLGLLPCAGPQIEPRNPEDTGFGDDQVAVLQPRPWNTRPPEDPDTPTVEHDWPFLSSKPKLFEEGGVGGRNGESGSGGSSTAHPGPRAGRVHVWPQSSLALRSPDVAPQTSMPWAPKQLRCKLKSGHSVASALATGLGIFPGGPDSNAPPSRPTPSTSPKAQPPGSVDPDPVLQQEAERLDPFTAARINEHIVRSVLSRLPQRVQELYERSPRRLAFGPDLHMREPPAWAASSLSFTDHLVNECDGNSDDGGEAAWRPLAGAGGVVLRSPRITTPPGETRFDGMLYCTVISEAQAFEYILYESQKGPGIEVDAEGVLLRSKHASEVPLAAGVSS